MKSIDLKETCPAGGPDSARRFYADGKRISRLEFQAIKNKADKLECFSNSRNGGIDTFYCVARVAPTAPQTAQIATIPAGEGKNTTPAGFGPCGELVATLQMAETVFNSRQIDSLAAFVAIEKIRNTLAKLNK